jgi:hypothetical protein
VSSSPTGARRSSAESMTLILAATQTQEATITQNKEVIELNAA